LGPWADHESTHRIFQRRCNLDEKIVDIKQDTLVAYGGSQ
jgi:hypothetical protein